jgi:hypothetical protein
MSKENEAGGMLRYFRKPTTTSREPVCPTAPTTSASIHFSSEFAPFSGLRPVYPLFRYDYYASAIS